MSQFKILKELCVLLSVISWITGSGANFVTSEDFNAEVIANISTPRGLLVDEVGDILVLARGDSSVIALYPGNEESVSFNQTVIINGTNLALNHGIAFNKGHLYVSSGSTVYRWPYQPGQRSLVETAEEIVISNISIPDANKQNTRTLIFDTEDLLYVTINSDIRLDNDSHRCRIMRFNITNLPGPIEYDSGELFADGLRNEVGLALDADGVLWGVENAGGADYLIREDLGGNIHDGNPAEELNRFDKPPGTHYGYPYCFGTYDLKDYETGTQFAWPTAMNDGIHTDEWCRQESNNARAVFFMPAHEAPLGLEFYTDIGNSCSNSSLKGAFPCSAKGSAIIAYHGSMNISIPVGYKVSMFPFNPDTKVPTGQSVDIIYDNSQEKTFRPVSAVFNKLGQLIVSADSSNQVIKISYVPSDNSPAAASTQITLFPGYVFLVVVSCLSYPFLIGN